MLESEDSINELFSENEIDDSASEDELENVHDRLVTAIDKFSKYSDTKVASKSLISSKTIQNLSGHYIDDSSMRLSMDALLSALDGSQGLSTVKQQLSEFENSLNNSIPKNIDKVISQRAERNIVYESTAKDMNKWHDLVTSNRHERTLDLTNDKHNLPTMRNLIHKFQPSNDLEKDIQMVLFKTATNESDALANEMNELQSRGLTIQEIHNKQAELAKVKARMFYEQMKRHRINKIKSKAYHRIRKKQKQRQNEKELELLQLTNPEKARETLEEQATKRIKERMDLKHKNTSKWAKMALQHGRHDPTLREAYHEAVQLGNDLLKKYDEVPDATDDDIDDNQEDWSDDNEDEDGNMVDSSTNGSTNKKNVAKKIARALSRVINIDEDSDQPVVDGKYKKLYEMDFMKRASKQKQIRLQDEAKNIMKELELMRDDEENQDSDVEYHRSDANEQIVDSLTDDHLFQGARKAIISKAKMVSSSSDGMIDTSLISTSRTKMREYDNTLNTVDSAMNQSAATRMEESSNPWLESKPSIKYSNSNSTEYQVKPENVDSSTTYGKSKKSRKNGKQSAEKTSEDTMKPLRTNGTNEIQNESSNIQLKKKEKKHKRGIDVNETIAVKENLNHSETTESIRAQNISVNTKKSIMPEKKPLVLQKSQAEIVQIAFAGPNLEEEFQQYKEQMIHEELGFDSKRKDVLKKVKPGWGDWAGPGNMLISSKIQSIRDRELKKIENDENSKKQLRKDKKLPNVMISERRIKCASKYLIGEIPHPFTTREEYEQSIRMPLGEEANASHIVKENVKPDVLIRSGRVIEPIKQPKKRTKPDTSSMSNNTGKDIQNKKRRKIQ